MKILRILLVTLTIFFTQISFADKDKYEAGEKLYKTNCAVCHGSSSGMDLKKRIAPPIAAVRMHYINTFPDEDSFVQAISGWVENQDESKSMMRGAIRKFNIMPPISIPKEDAMKIAAYIYGGNLDSPKGLKKHVEEEHSKAVAPAVANNDIKSNTQGITVSISLSDKLKSQASSTDLVFIYAKAMSGPPMPLAVVKKQVKDLPIEIVLNDEMAMMPNLKLSGFSEIKVGARISKSGQPIARNGDLFSEKASIKVGDKVSIEIDTVVVK
ncbi:MAG: cytochrome c [Cocleimonas sp.]|nr:cytochrome c [Cocleimonas sp.]